MQSTTDTAADDPIPIQADPNRALKTSQAPITIDFPVEILLPVFIFLMFLFYGTEFITSVYVAPVILAIPLAVGAIMSFKRWGSAL